MLSNNESSAFKTFSNLALINLDWCSEDETIKKDNLIWLHIAFWPHEDVEFLSFLFYFALQADIKRPSTPPCPMKKKELKPDELQTHQGICHSFSKVVNFKPSTRFLSKEERVNPKP